MYEEMRPTFDQQEKKNRDFNSKRKHAAKAEENIRKRY